MKKTVLLSGFIFCMLSVSAQLLSPRQFLGYPVGTHFTLGYKIDDYFSAVATAKPNMVKVEKYGQTYEGRDLILAYIGLPENLQRLEEIRKNNLRITGMLKDNIAPQTTGVPAILWLSYNVHGNEPSSAEAAMLTLYALVSDSNTQTKDWLKNLVVVIDPIENPDGHDRYVNWYNSTVGVQFNADPQAREHREPWPQGRTNHYNFDLNRDWAWQTQLETQQRLKKYQEWMPQVHVDFHEQGPNSPYYFAPAAEPYHEVITQWQRDFQVMVGKNNAKYFDANGWLYFTREEFDLFYPSYGDTYPLYSGAIGMTYEQGGIGAGLGIRLEDEDTLTLADRIMHHYTTSMATIETVSKNAKRLVSEFKQFYDNSVNAVNAPYKTYVMTSKDINQLQEIAALLDKNHIRYGITNAKNFHGYNYFTGKEEAYKEEGFQLAISAFQPRSTLLRVLFEPKSFLEDSVTYDITAWSLPYAYNIKTYGIKDKLPVGGSLPTTNITRAESNYGLLIPYTSFNASQVLAYLLSHGVKVRFTDKAFTYNGKNYSAGTLIVLRGNNVNNWNAVVNDACSKYNIQAIPVESGFVEKGSDFGSGDVQYIHAPKVAMLTGGQVDAGAAGEVWHLFDQTLQYPITLLNADDLNRLDISKYNTLIFPAGSYTILSNRNVQEKLHQFVLYGGKIIAMEDAVVQLAKNGWDISIRENQLDSVASDSDYTALRVYGSRERSDLSQTIIGAIYQLDMDTTHPLAYGYPNFYYTLKSNSSIVNFLKDGWNVGVIKKAAYTAGFVGSKLKPQLKDAMVFGVQNEGEGSMVYLTEDPLFRLFWQGGKMLFCNAVFLVGQ
ncbi:zinc carboxypeptidase [Ilyomonas limi]|uniref:Zinc carboxypeptidase n=1 Tax=Ilyomonas limi TaxID=2575867 RepID=A0A4U3KXV8_9BACT|nr:M14 metallopeptidase family protein [Ilyomonas limi]TKK67485.1 zinc carboxypeptidase [Ilyomonas limi]